MLELYKDGNDNLKPNSSSYTIIINACAFSPNRQNSKDDKSFVLQIALDIMEELAQCSYANPTDITYGTFIKACGRLLGSSDKELLNNLLRKTLDDARNNDQLSNFVLKQLKQASRELYDEVAEYSLKSL